MATGSAGHRAEDDGHISGQRPRSLTLFWITGLSIGHFRAITMACATETAEAKEEHGSRDDAADHRQDFSSEEWSLLFLCKDTRVRVGEGWNAAYLSVDSIV